MNIELVCLQVIIGTTMALVSLMSASSPSFCINRHFARLLIDRGRRGWCLGCGGELTEPSGQISSPNYPQPYPILRECVWHIRVAPGKRVNLTIADFDMEAHDSCQYDMLAVSGRTFCPVLFYTDHPSVATRWTDPEISKKSGGIWRVCGARTCYEVIYNGG